jgi:hypothetical protein
MITIPPRLRSGNPALDVWAERMRRSLRTAMPFTSNTVGISRTPQGTVHTSFVKGRRGGRVGAITGGGIGFTGKVWLPTSSGTRVLYLANTDAELPNIHVDKSGLSVPAFVEETNAPIPSSWGPDEFWYPKAEIAGSIIVP